MKRPPLGTRFTVLVVPADAVKYVEGPDGQPALTIPRLVTAAEDYLRTIPVAALAGPKHVEAALWAFGGKSKTRVIYQLRDLADWLERGYMEAT